MTSPYISIIMPVYKSEKYLRKSIEAVLSQSFKDFELLLVDDCSPDNSGAICDEYSQKDNRVKVLHLAENGGAGNARNEAMKVVKGKYLCFLDADDYFDSNMLETLVTSVKENPAKVVIFGLIEEYLKRNGKVANTKTVTYENKILRDAQSVRNEVLSLELVDLYGYPCNKMYDVEFLKSNGAVFPQMKFNEDIIFNIDVFMDIDSCNILDFAPYHYIKHSGSTTGSFIPTYFNDIMMKIDKLYDQFEYWNMLDDKNLNTIALRYVRCVFSALERNLDKRSKMNSQQQKDFLAKEFSSERFKNFENHLYGGGLIGIMAKIYKTKNVSLCISLAKIISFVKKQLPTLFSIIS